MRAPQRVVAHSAAASLVTAATLELAGVGEGAEDAQGVLNVTNASSVPNAHQGQHVVLDRACQLLNCSVGLPVHVYDMDLPTSTIPMRHRDDFKTATSYRVGAVIVPEGPEGTSYYVNGDDFVGKWDRCGVSEYSYLS